MNNTDFLLLQINDALFPIGGYSHSYGLETYIQKDLLRSEDQIVKYIKNRLEYSLASTELLGARLAWQNANNLSYLRELDEILTASKLPSEILSASVKLGSRFIKTLKHCDIELEYDYFKYYSEGEHSTKHHSTAYGVVCRAANADIKKSISAFVYSQCSQMVTNCVKTVPLSQSSGQKILYGLHSDMEKITDRVLSMNENELCASTPAFDIRAMQHETLYSRLYMS